MLSAKRSLGNLRATAARAPAVSSPANNRNLVSAVLLSRSQFERRTVKQLQEELSERGLSTSGKKNALVDRLLESVSRGTVGPSSSSTSSFSTSSRPAKAAATPTKKGGAVRDPEAVSTTSDSTAKNSDSAEASTETTSSVEAPASESKVISAEIPVHNPSPVTIQTELPTAGEGPEDQGVVTAAPGQVVDVKELERVEAVAEQAPGGGIELPQFISLPGVGEAEDRQAEAMIPVSPDFYQTNPTEYDPYQQPFTMHPSWLSLSETPGSVVHQGQPNTPTDDPNSRTSETRPEFQYMPDTTFLQEVAATLGIKLKSKPKAAAKEAGKEGSRVLQALEVETGFKVSTIGEALKESPDTAPKYKFQDRDLNGEEKNGLYILAGLLGGGLLLGGLGRTKKAPEKAEKKEGDKDSKKY